MEDIRSTKELKAAPTEAAMKRLQKENTELRAQLEEIQKATQQLYKHCQELEDSWSLTRANFLLEIIKNKVKFTPFIANRALKEFENFIYPKDFGVQKVEPKVEVKPDKEEA